MQRGFFRCRRQTEGGRSAIAWREGAIPFFYWIVLCNSSCWITLYDKMPWHPGRTGCHRLLGLRDKNTLHHQSRLPAVVYPTGQRHRSIRESPARLQGSYGDVPPTVAATTQSETSHTRAMLEQSELC